MPPNDQPQTTLPQVDPLGGYETPPQQPTQPKSKRKLIIIGGLVVVVAVAIAALLLTKSEDTSTGNTNSTNGNVISSTEVSFKAPDGWDEDSEPQPGAIKSYTLAAASDSDSLAPSISIIVSAADDQSLDRFAINTTNALRENFSDYAEISSTEESVGGLPALLVTSTYSLAGTPMTNQLLLTIKGQKAYLLTALLPTASWDENQEAIQQALLGFRP